MVTASGTAESVDIQPKISVLREKSPIPFNPWWIITSFLATVALSVSIYILVDWHLYEVLTRDLVLVLLDLTGVESSAADFAFPWAPHWGQFGEAAPNTPGIVIPGTPHSAFWIVKACTGMQAGAILISLIVVTPLPSKTASSSVPLAEMSFRERLRTTHPMVYHVLHKAVVILVFFLILFVANFVRIWFHLYLVGAYGLPFEFAHDDLSKPIGFVGTLIFAWTIEKMGVPIIDTFADWLDATIYGAKSAYKRIVG